MLFNDLLQLKKKQTTNLYFLPQTHLQFSGSPQSQVPPVAGNDPNTKL